MVNLAKEIEESYPTEDKKLIRICFQDDTDLLIQLCDVLTFIEDEGLDEVEVITNGRDYRDPCCETVTRYIPADEYLESNWDQTIADFMNDLNSKACQV